MNADVKLTGLLVRPLLLTILRLLLAHAAGMAFPTVCRWNVRTTATYKWLNALWLTCPSTGRHGLNNFRLLIASKCMTGSELYFLVQEKLDVRELLVYL